MDWIYRMLRAQMAMVMPPCAMLRDDTDPPGVMHMVVPVDAEDLGDQVRISMAGVWHVNLSDN